MSTPVFHLVHLYPLSMSTYGDTGNIKALKYTLERAGWEIKITNCEVGDPLPKDADCYFFGGGQDLAQSVVEGDLVSKADILRNHVAAGLPLLAICGGYQLLGKAYHPFEADSIVGLDIFPVETYASKQRMVGNLIVEANPDLGLNTASTIVGYENHSGKTRLTRPDTPTLGKVVQGYGNNGEDATEGCVVEGAIGCYLHGPLLPKNPHMTRWLLSKWRQARDIDEVLPDIDERLAWQAHQAIVSRYRGSTGI